MKRYFFVLLLAGCVDPNQQRLQQAEQYRQMQEAYRQQVIGQCRAYGFRDGTPEFRNCLMQVDMANQAQDAQMRSVILQQLLHQQGQGRPLCSSLPPYIAGVERSRGGCR